MPRPNGDNRNGAVPGFTVVGATFRISTRTCRSIGNEPEAEHPCLFLPLPEFVSVQVSTMNALFEATTGASGAATGQPESHGPAPKRVRDLRTHP